MASSDKIHMLCELDVASNCLVGPQYVYPIWLAAMWNVSLKENTFQLFLSYLVTIVDPAATDNSIIDGIPRSKIHPSLALERLYKQH